MPLRSSRPGGPRPFHALVALLFAFTFVLCLVPGGSGANPEPLDPTAPAAPAPDTSAPFIARQLSGLSGGLRVLMGTPAALLQNPLLQPFSQSLALSLPGVHPLAPAAAPGDESFNILSLVPFDQLRTTLRGYNVGSWPKGMLTATSARYAMPEGFIQVTEQNRMTPVSRSFKLADFLTHDQQGVWPKVLVLRTPLVDKLELIRKELELRGLPSQLHVMSGFRTPQYNAQGVGEKGGRATFSRHMYGDASDVFVDADGDGRMDDLDGDHRVTLKDARVLFAAAEAVEAQYPELVGGLSAYPATKAHGPFVHVDTRGSRARW